MSTLTTALLPSDFNVISASSVLSFKRTIIRSFSDYLYYYESCFDYESSIAESCELTIDEFLACVDSLFVHYTTKSYLIYSSDILSYLQFHKPHFKHFISFEDVDTPSFPYIQNFVFDRLVSSVCALCKSVLSDIACNCCLDLLNTYSFSYASERYRDVDYFYTYYKSINAI